MRPIGQMDADFVFTYFHQGERAVASLMLVMESFLFSKCTQKVLCSIIKKLFAVQLENKVEMQQVGM